jgi:DNA polymerase-3 subunit epsilon
MGFLKKMADVVDAAKRANGAAASSSYGEFIVVDVETTGLSPIDHRVVQIALVRVNNGIITEMFESLFNPEGLVGKTEIHGITQSQVDTAPYFRDKVSEIAKFIEGRTLVAHNARFDLAFMRAEFDRSGAQLPWIEPFCTLRASEYYLPNLERRKLSDCCDAIGIKIEDAHTATGDAMATAKLCHYYLMSEKKPAPRKSDLDLIANPRINREVKATSERTHVRERIERNSIERQIPSMSTLLKLSNLIKGIGIADISTKMKIEGSAEYLEKVVEFLEDKSLTASETSQLEDLCTLYEISEMNRDLLHSELLILLIELALEDEKISVAERTEFKDICNILNLADSRLPALTKEAKNRRHNKLSGKLNPLPDGWKLGDPLRVGNNVVFTGCEPIQRQRLEVDSRKAGVTIASGVSKKTNLLVTDGSYQGNKAADAAALGVRIVTPDEYEVLLKFIQPPL